MSFIYASIDTETTGIDSDNCELVEIGMVLDNLSVPKPIAELPVFHCYVNKDVFKGEPYALSMHPQIFRRIATKEEGFNYFYPGEIPQKMREFLALHDFPGEYNKPIRFNVTGKNFGTFDLRFLQKLPRFGDFLRPRHRILDPGSLYFDPRVDEQLPGFELCLERAGMEPNVKHTAVEDAIDTIKLVRRKYGISID